MPTPTHKELANLALQFLSRVQLQGAEVPPFVAASDLLRRITEGELSVVTTEFADRLATVRDKKADKASA